MRLCGITSRFQLLSPCIRQVTHALLTRPPLSHKSLHSEEIRLKCFVRLACVKHAASVHPEPGSNSHKKFNSVRTTLASFKKKFSFSVYLVSRFLFVSEYSQVFKAETTSKPVRIFRVVLLFSYQRASVIHAVRIVDSSFIISYSFCFVKNFFHFLWKHFSQSPWVVSKFFQFVLAATKFILPLVEWFVKNFFWKVLTFSDSFRNRTEKEGFEPSRRY